MKSLRIGFVSYEYPPETAGGGIGTYLECVAPELAQAGHEVTVFCGGEASRETRQNGVVVQRIRARSGQFGAAACKVFAVHHQRQPFDVVEVADYAAWGLGIQQLFPRLPCVVKLHTPSFVIDSLHWRCPSLGQRLRMGLGAVRRGRPWPRFEFYHGASHLQEMESISRAGGVAATTFAVLRRIAQEVPEAAAKARVYPYPFSPSPVLLSAEADGEGDAVTYVGRLEPRKGVFELAATIPELCRRHADICFRFIGRDMPSDKRDRSCSEVILQFAGAFRHRVEILPAQPREVALRLMAKSKICVFPSRWESFGIVVLEAMAAARAVVVTKGSGMAELVEEGQTGLTVEPCHSRDLCEGISKLWQDRDLRCRLAASARESVLRRFDVAEVLKLQLDHYREVMGRRSD